MNSFNPDVVLMAELTWYTLDTLDEFLSSLRTYALSRQKPTFLIHLLTTYKPEIRGTAPKNSLIWKKF